MTDSLKPCPFCHGAMIGMHEETQGRSVSARCHCLGCQAKGPPSPFMDRVIARRVRAGVNVRPWVDEAQRLWNGGAPRTIAAPADPATAGRYL